MERPSSSVLYYSFKQLHIIITVSIIFTSAALGDESIDVIRTAGKGQLERVTDYLLFSTSNKTLNP